MSRRDTIIIAVIVNVGMLALLFLLAMDPDDDNISSNAMTQELAIASSTAGKQEKYTNLMSQYDTAFDEVDTVLNDFAAAVNIDSYDYEGSAKSCGVITTAPSQSSSPTKKEEVGEFSSQQKWVEVSVKRGDVLEKIAKANGITVESIKKANSLVTDSLKVGQQLKIPIASSLSKKQSNANSVGDHERYYEVRSGDSPWKIAKQYHINLDDLLKMNNLDEAKARNLKIGDKLKVK